MSPRHRAGDHRRAAAADDRRRARRVMRCLEGRRQCRGHAPGRHRPRAIACDSNASARVSSGRTPTSRSASIVLPTPGRPVREQVVPADRRELDNFTAPLADDVGKVPHLAIGVQMPGVPTRPAGCLPSVRSRHTPRRVRPGGGGDERSPLRQGEPRRHSRPARRHGAHPRLRLPSPRKDPRNRPDRAVQTQLPKCTDRAATDASITSADREHGDRDGQVSSPNPCFGMEAGES